MRKNAASIALCMALALTVTVLAPAGAHVAVSTNALRDNPGGTVPIIHVDSDTSTPTPSEAVCPNPGAASMVLATCNIDFDVTLDSNDLNTATVQLGTGTIPVEKAPADNLNGTVVNLYLLNGSEPADFRKTDCTRPEDTVMSEVLQLGADWNRTFIGSDTFGSTGFATISKNVTLQTNTISTLNVTYAKWTYGLNWLCATTASSAGGVGGIGDEAFLIKP